MSNSIVERGDDDQFVTFNIGKEIFGISVFRVQEVFNLPEITDVPNLPPFTRGVIDLRGVIVPLIDMREKFALEEKDYDDNTAVVIVEHNNKIYGLIVDLVLDVAVFPIESVSESQDGFIDSKNEVVKGIGRIDEKLVIVLDVDELFAVDVVKLMA